jgi:hypothetical protein
MITIKNPEQKKSLLETFGSGINLQINEGVFNLWVRGLLRKSTLLNIVGLLDEWRSYIEPGRDWLKERIQCSKT